MEKVKGTKKGEFLKHQILAIDSTEQACSVALSVNGEVTQLLEMAPRKHSEMLLPMVEQILNDAALPLVELDAIAFACGPGSFTGLRIATGVVQGLAYGADLPVVPVSSLASLAHAAFRRQFESKAMGSNVIKEKDTSKPLQVLAALDARMNEVYVVPYRVEKLGVITPLGAELVCSPQNVAERYENLLGEPLVGAGSGWCYSDVFLQRFSGLSGFQADVMIEATDVLYLAQPLFEAGQTVIAEKALPVYLRESITWKKLPGRE